MGFRNKDGDFLGNQSNYEYKGKQSINRIKAKKKHVFFWMTLFIALLFMAALFLLYLALFDKVHNADKNDSLLSAVFFFALAFYIIYRSRKYLREEKQYEKELEKLENKKD